jgi:hypothetical protein
MKGVINWLMGEEITEAAIKGLNWLLEVPPDRSATKGKTNDDIAIEHMTNLLESMRANLVEIETIVIKSHWIVQHHQNERDLKDRYYQNLLGIAAQSHRQGNTLDARMAMIKAVQTKRVLTALDAKLKISQDRLIGFHEIYATKETDLVVLEMELEAIEIQSEMNDSLDGHRDLDKSRDLLALQEQFRNAQADIEFRYQEIQITSQLTNPSNCELGEPMNIEHIDNLIAALDDDESNPFPD